MNSIPKSNDKRTTLAGLLSGLLLVAIGLTANLQHSYGETTAKGNANAGIGGTVSTLVGGNNENASANANANATAQSSASANASANGQEQEHYKSGYDKMQADSSDKLVVQTDHHLYQPGDSVKIEGNVESSLVNSLQLNGVSVQVTDNNGAMINTNTLQLSDGSFETSIVLPSDAKQGAYTVQSMLLVNASLLGTLNADIKAQLQASDKFVVVSPSAFAVKAKVNGDQEKDYSIDIASNSTVSNVSFDTSQKQLAFTVEGQSGTHGVTQITIPKEMLSGNLQVDIDGAAATSGDVIVTEDVSSQTTLEINYHHSTHTVTITGTSVVPEFPLSTVLVTAGAIGSVVVLASRMGRFIR